MLDILLFAFLWWMFGWEAAITVAVIGIWLALPVRQ